MSKAQILKHKNQTGKITRKKLLMLFLIIILVSAFLYAYAEPGIVVTDGGRLNMRKSPEDRAKIVTKIKNGKTIEVLDHEDGWYHITYEGHEGYVKEKFIKLLSDTVGKEIYSNGITVYLREQMDINSRIVGMINAQQAMKVEQISSEWALVSSGNVKGYVQTQDLDQLNEEPAAAATQKWTECILQKETTLYREPDKKSEVLSIWPKGQGVAVSPYNKNWYLIQIQDENICGFAWKGSVSISPLPTVQPDKQQVDESKYISASKAKSIAEKALKKYPGFNAKALVCSQDTALSTDGIRGPMFRFNYSNKKGQYVYAAYVHAYTGELLYTGDYSDFADQQDTSDLRTAPPKTTQDPQWWYDDDGNVVWAEETPKPSEGTDIGQSSARSISDRYLSAKYPRFSQMSFSRVNCRHARPGAGRKKSAVKDKAAAGNPGGRPLEILDIPEMEGVEMPKPHDFLSAEQRDGNPLQATEIYENTWNWLKSIGCASKVSPQLLERYTMCSARWIQCEETTSKLGFLSKHPTTGKPIPSPFINIGICHEWSRVLSLHP